MISGQGHEGAQVGIAWAFEKGHDWIAPFYRSIATCLTFGMSAARHHDRPVRDGQRPVVGRPPDARPLRHRASTTSCRSRRRSRPSSCTRSGIALAAKIRKTGPGRDDRRWARARRTRATSTRASTSRRSTSCRSCSWSRTTATRSACRPRWRSRSRTSPTRASGYGIPGVVVDGADVLACYAAARDAVARARAGRRPDADRGQGDPADRATRRTTSRRSTAPPRSSTPSSGHDALPRFREQLRDAGVLTDEIEARARPPRSRPPSRTRPTTPRPQPDPDPATATALRLRRRAPRASTDAAAHVHRGDPRDARRRDAPRRVGHRPRRGRRQEGRRLPRHRRPVGRVRRGPGHRHAADRVDDRRRVDRRGGQRPAAGRRDPVRRLHLPGVQPDRVRGGPDALPLEQRLRRADDDPRARTAAASTARSTTRSRSRRSSPTCRASRWSCRRRRTTPAACCGRRSATRTRSSSSSTRRCTARVRGDVPDTRLHRPAREGRGHPPGLAGDGRRVRADGPLRAGGRRPRRRGRDQRRGRRPADAPPARPRDAARLASARPASAWSSTRTTSSAATARRSPRSSPRRRSTTSTARSRGSPAPRSRACPYNHVLEDWFMVNPEKIADGIRKLAAY